MKGMIIMNLRNLLKQGDYVMPIPLGIHITVQYNLSGNMEKLYVGFGSDRVDHTSELLPVLLKNRLIPTNIQLKTGTSWVQGILYSANIPRKSGALPIVAEDTLLKDFMNEPTHFNFFATTITSTGMEFTSINGVRQFLTLNRFRVLPSFNVPIKVLDNMLETWINSPQYTFTDVITDLVIYRDNKSSILPMHMTIHNVKSANEYIDSNGYVKLKVVFDDSDIPKYINYSDAVQYNIQTGSTMILSSDGEIWKCLPSPKKVVRQNIITCGYCGKKYMVPSTGLVQCPDIHCSSKLVSSIEQFCGVLELPIPKVSTIDSWLKAHIVTCIPDLLILEEYKDVVCKTTISKLLRALIPMTIIRSDAVLTDFALACSNHVDSLKYYITHPDMVTTDLSLSSHDTSQLVAWLSDDCNASDLSTLLNSSQIEIVESHKKFDGAPIFRDKTIFITGSFIHGDIGYISEILQSYSAKVTTKFSNVVSCVLTGGKQEGTDGRAIRSARNLQIPIMDELTFFRQYDIDSDLSSCPNI